MAVTQPQLAFDALKILADASKEVVYSMESSSDRTGMFKNSIEGTIYRLQTLQQSINTDE